jgi:phospholipid/cholesterol/gamma-HCH transport system substrate-binding protein
VSRHLSAGRALILGLAVVSAAAVGTYAFYQVHARKGLGADAFRVEAAFADIGGVQAGTRVRLQGIDVGEVVEVVPPAEPGQKVALKLRIAGKVRHLVRQDARIKIEQPQLVGDKTLRLVPGSIDAEPITDGATLAAVESPELIDSLTQSATKLNSMLGDIDASLQAFRKGAGSAEEIASDLRQATTRLNNVLGKIDVAMGAVEKGEGTLGKLVKDDSLHREMVAALEQMKGAIGDVRSGNGTLGKLVKNDGAYAEAMQSLADVRKMVASVKQNADAIKSLPLVRDYVVDAQKELVRPDSQRSRKVFAVDELFQPGRAILTAEGKKRLDDAGKWLAKTKPSGSEIVVAAMAAPGENADFAVTLTQKQSEAVAEYLRSQHSVHRMGWWSSRAVKPIGCGTEPPQQPESETLPAGRIEVILFSPAS